VGVNRLWCLHARLVEGLFQHMRRHTETMHWALCSQPCLLPAQSGIMKLEYGDVAAGCMARQCTPPHAAFSTTNAAAAGLENCMLVLCIAAVAHGIVTV